MDINTETLKLSLETVRLLAVVKQGLHRRPAHAGRQALLDAIRRIGLLQLDTVHIVARSHYLVMLSRVGLYDPADLDTLLYPERRLFEGWAHAACLIPVEQYPRLAPAIHATREQDLPASLFRGLGEKPQEGLDAILAEVRARGPVASREFEDPRKSRTGWWDWKPAKDALEFLFLRGHLMIDRRENFQRFYDLAERVLPESAEAPAGTVEEYRRWAAARGVWHLGVATAAQACDYYRLKRVPTREALRALQEEGALLTVEVDGWKDLAYLCPEDLPLVREIEAGEHRPAVTTLLSPFDNLIWDRARVRDLFGFDYRIEIYTPAPQRRYGYYVMPILHRGRLVGRLDPKADRQSKGLFVRGLYLEPGESAGDDLVAGLASALREFMRFHGSRELVLQGSDPQGLAPRLREQVEAGKDL
jgi:uncharacterized protein YcaQ